MNSMNLLNRITNYYLQSGDFNGLHSSELSNEEKGYLESLILEGKSFILSEDSTQNIYINALNTNKTPREQIECIQKDIVFAAYPSTEHLRNLQIDEQKYFTKMLAYGAEQLKVLYFSVDILEHYMNDPQYHIQDHGYVGNICINRDVDDEENPIFSEYIKDYGIAYPTKLPIDADRAIGVFLRDLSKLNEQAQYKWAGFLLPDQTSFKVNGHFLKNLIYAEWVTECWIFEALLAEISYINILCKNIGIPKFFRKEYSLESREVDGYRIILIPTLKNYYEFVGILEKIVVHNINYDTFQKTALVIKAIERRDKNGEVKGSLAMLEEWLSINYISYNPYLEERIKDEVFIPLRKIRKERQIYAHELYSNERNNSLYKKQNDLIRSTYDALMILRLILNSHPKNKKLQAPSIIRDYENIVVY